MSRNVSLAVFHYFERDVSDQVKSLLLKDLPQCLTLTVLYYSNK